MSRAKLYIGVDLGRSTRIAVVDESGLILYQRRDPSHLESGRLLIDGLIDDVQKTIRESEELGKVRAVGFGLPGLVESPTNHVVMLPNLADISSIDIFQEVSTAVGVPVAFDNDANAAAIGEWKCGAARGVRDFIYITLGTGIGAGIVEGGALQRGARGFAGEFGHLKITTNGMECSCGSSGCLETLASGPNIVRRAREKLFSDPAFAQSPLAEKMRGKLTCEDVVEEALAGDKLAESIISETGLYLGMTIANVVNLLNCEMVILGGPVMRRNQPLLDAALEEASRRAFSPSFSSCRVVAGELGEDAKVIGSAMIARDLVENPQL